MSGLIYLDGVEGSGDTKEDRVHARTDTDSGLIVLLPHELSKSLSVASAGHEPPTVRVGRNCYLKYSAET